MIKYLITITVLTFSWSFIHRIFKYKIKSIKPRQIQAEILIENSRKKQIRSLKVEKAYNITKYNFNNALKNREIDRSRIIAIRDYLKVHTDKWEWSNKKFKNEAHCIYHLMKSKSLKVRDFELINMMIGVV